MKVKVTLNNATGEIIEGEGAVDEMGITVQKPVNLVVAGKESEVTMIMIPWHIVMKFEYVVSEAMIKAQNAMANAETPQADLVQPNRAQRRAAAKV